MKDRRQGGCTCAGFHSFFWPWPRWPLPAGAAEIEGDYLETRSADVWTGPCFANGETGLVGREAILAWRVEKGAWQGVALDGLSVVGVVKASATLGDPFASPYPAKAVMIVDEKATADQRAALVAFAQEMGGGILDTVVRTEVAPIAMSVSRGRSRGARDASGRRAGPDRDARGQRQGQALRQRRRLLPAADVHDARAAGGGDRGPVPRRRAGRLLDDPRQAQRVRGHVLEVSGSPPRE